MFEYIGAQCSDLGEPLVLCPRLIRIFDSKSQTFRLPAFFGNPMRQLEKTRDLILFREPKQRVLDLLRCTTDVVASLLGQTSPIIGRLIRESYPPVRLRRPWCVEQHAFSTTTRYGFV